jgi:hypothetical protein
MVGFALQHPSADLLQVADRIDSLQLWMSE